MNISLTQKERMLLEDQKSHEQLCIEKYTEYANQATDPQLKQIFTNNLNQENEHLNSINQLLSGQIPDMNAQGTNQQANQAMPTNATNVGAGLNVAADSKLCEDILMTEKYVSSGYDTTIFEFRDTNARDLLNHIQKEEQKHGEAVYKYMESKGMYNPK
ncbi:spore coat protein [Clostridium sp. MB40-C1]|uniref:ferritin-like domain-containing protein n=1 Tax=Clostridium sp. MB40-C1 TaxID=3070996 RepID=UPI0027E114D2|nr:spore coat protein [Clostridium sp. MB40-C1]WMJ80918.1 spore coat protein [Clostridium sp. MB40-C1]